MYCTPALYLYFGAKRRGHAVLDARRHRRSADPRIDGGVLEVQIAGGRIDLQVVDRPDIELQFRAFHVRVAGIDRHRAGRDRRTQAGAAAQRQQDVVVFVEEHGTVHPENAGQIRFEADFVAVRVSGLKAAPAG